MQPTLLAEMFLVEAEGISLCLRVLEPGRSVSVLVASMECVLQAASNPEEFVRELVADQVLEHEGGGKPPRYRWHLGCILLKMPAISLLRQGVSSATIRCPTCARAAASLWSSWCTS